MSDLIGARELQKALAKLESKAQNKVIRRGVAKMAQVVRNDMKRSAPASTGTMKKNIKYTTKRMQRGGFVAKVGAFNSAFYAHFVEYGTKPHRIPKKKNRKKRVVIGGRVISNVQHPGAKAKPFIEPSFKRSKAKALNEAGKLMFQLLVKT